MGFDLFLCPLKGTLQRFYVWIVLGQEKRMANFMINIREMQQEMQLHQRNAKQIKICVDVEIILRQKTYSGRIYWIVNFMCNLIKELVHCGFAVVPSRHGGDRCVLNSVELRRQAPEFKQHRLAFLLSFFQIVKTFSEFLDYSVQDASAIVGKRPELLFRRSRICALKRDCAGD